MFNHSVRSNSATPQTVARQTPLSMGILQARILDWVAMPSSRENSPRGLMPCPPSGLTANPRIKLGSSALQADSLPAELPGKPDEHVYPLYITEALGIGDMRGLLLTGHTANLNAHLTHGSLRVFLPHFPLTPGQQSGQGLALSVLWSAKLVVAGPCLTAPAPSPSSITAYWILEYYPR